MRTLQVLVYYTSVVWETNIVAEYKGDGTDYSLDYLKYVGELPLYHRRFSITVRKRMYCWLMNGPFTYCAVVDEALKKEIAFRFLESIMEQVLQMLDKKKLVAVGEDLALCPLKEDFLSIIRHSLIPLDETTTEDLHVKEEALPENENLESELTDSALLEAPLFTRTLPGEHSKKAVFPCLPLTRVNSCKHETKMLKEAFSEFKQNSLDGRGRTMERTLELEVLFEDAEQSIPVQKSFSMKARDQLTHRTWWRRIKVILFLNILTLLVLLSAWLGLCKGFRCVTD